MFKGDIYFQHSVVLFVLSHIFQLISQSYARYFMMMKEIEEKVRTTLMIDSSYRFLISMHGKICQKVTTNKETHIILSIQNFSNFLEDDV